MFEDVNLFFLPNKHMTLGIYLTLNSSYYQWRDWDQVIIKWQIIQVSDSI